MRPFLRLVGLMNTLPRLTQASIKMVEMRREEGSTAAVSDNGIDRSTLT